MRFKGEQELVTLSEGLKSSGGESQGDNHYDTGRQVPVGTKGATWLFGDRVAAKEAFLKQTWESAPCQLTKDNAGVL